MTSRTSPTPDDVLCDLMQAAKDGDFDIVIDLGYDDEAQATVADAYQSASRNLLPPDIEAAALALAGPLLRMEISDMSFSKRLSGSLTIQRNGNVWMDVEDVTGDWDYQRTCDIDALPDQQFTTEDLEQGFRRSDLVEAYGYEILVRADTKDLPRAVCEKLERIGKNLDKGWTHACWSPHDDADGMILFGGEEAVRTLFARYARDHLEPPRLYSGSAAPAELELA